MLDPGGGAGSSGGPQPLISQPPSGSTAVGFTSNYTAQWNQDTIHWAGLFDSGILMGPSSSYGDGKSYSSMMARHESMQIIYCWFTEQCGPRLYMGPYSAMTQEVMIDPQVDQVRSEWATRGYPAHYARPTMIDNRDPNTPLSQRLLGGGKLLAKEHGALVPVYLFGPFGAGDTSAAAGDMDGTGILGSFDSVSIYNLGNDTALFEVLNVTGWASGTRIPGTNWGLPDTAQGDWGPGGRFEQVFVWVEPITR